MDAWIQWNRDGFVAGVAGAVTTAFDQRFVRVHARGAWLVAVAEPLQLALCAVFRVLQVGLIKRQKKVMSVLECRK